MSAEAIALQPLPSFTDLPKATDEKDKNNDFGVVLSSDDAKQFFKVDDWKFLRSAGVTIGQDATTLQTELFADTLGVFQVAFSAGLSAGDDSTQKDVQRFLASGGNASLEFRWPAFFFRQSWIRGAFYVVPKLSADLPIAGSSTTTVTLNGDAGFEALVALVSDNDQFAFTIQARAAAVLGTDPFVDSIGVEDNGFGYLRVAFGLIVGSVFQIQVSGVPVAPQSLKDNQPWMISVGLLPSADSD